jgi:hypothetical protein
MRNIIAQAGHAPFTVDVMKKYLPDMSLFVHDNINVSYVPDLYFPQVGFALMASMSPT